jgi:CheY-like chemotaxis protein
MALEQRATWDGDAVSRQWRVVVVDDEDDIRALVRIMLGADGRFAIVAEAPNGREAVEAVATHKPDVVVLDLSMPVMDGIAALPLIREVAPDCRVAVCSAHGESSAYVLGIGADAYVDKLDLPRSLAHVLDDLCA